MSSFRLADAERLSLKHPCVASQHLLYGLFLMGHDTQFLSGDGGIHFKVAQKLGLTIPTLKQGILEVGYVLERTHSLEGFSFGESAVCTLERASESAAALSHSHIGTEHILLGLLSEESGGAATLFATHHIDTAKARQLILDEYPNV